VAPARPVVHYAGVPLTDGELLSRATELQAEGRQLLAELALPTVFPGFGSVEPVGSIVSGLMVWGDLDLMFSAPSATPALVLAGMRRLVEDPRIVAMDYHDERADRRPTPAMTDERFYLVCKYAGPHRQWKIDITIWLHDVARPTRSYAESLLDITDAQRLDILRLKEIWHKLPAYPYEIGGLDIYTAVLEHGVRTPEQFTAYLGERK